jgi:structural maintenance of chromosome 3 (chondroitin sulfate proteoglycan 6)
MEHQFKLLRREREDKEAERKRLWRDEAKLSTALDSFKTEFEKAQRSLLSTMDRNTSRGLQSVAAIAERLQLTGYYGPLFDLFEVDERFQSAVEVVAGSSLFHVVVDNDATATRILTVLNQEKSGRVTFMPLNRLRPHEQTYPDTQQAIPIIKRLVFDPKFKPAMQQVFGKAIIAPTLETASAFARSHSLTAVTMDGDLADRKGALTGGYHDFRQSRLEAIKAQKNVRAKKQVTERDLALVKTKINQYDQDILKIRDHMSRIDADRREALASRDPQAEQIRSLDK